MDRLLNDGAFIYSPLACYVRSSENESGSLADTKQL